MDHPINHISLCAGYGGIDLGLERVLPTCRTITYVEIEAFAIANLVAKMEAGKLAPAPVWTDLHTFPFDQFHGVVDIITAGFPCQPFSQSGKRDGVRDKRHLWPRIAEGIRRSRPTLVFMENVDGIATAKSPGYHSVLQHVLADLEGMGFRATAGLYTAAEVGAPHLRKRWFVLGLADTNDSGGGQDRQQSEPRPTRLEQPPDTSRCLQPQAIEQVTRWPAGPAEEQHDWEKPRTIERAVGRATNGATTRLDRLRLLGNGVVPQQAAKAFVELMEELTNE